VNYWNALPSSIVEAPSVNSFKAKIDKHWKGKKWSNIRLKAVGSMTDDVGIPELVIML